MIPYAKSRSCGTVVRLNVTLLDSSQVKPSPDDRWEEYSTVVAPPVVSPSAEDASAGVPLADRQSPQRKASRREGGEASVAAGKLTSEPLLKPRAESPEGHGSRGHDAPLGVHTQQRLRSEEAPDASVHRFVLCCNCFVQCLLCVSLYASAAVHGLLHSVVLCFVSFSSACITDS